MENEGEKTVRGEKEGSVSRNGESRERERKAFKATDRYPHINPYHRVGRIFFRR